MLGRDLAARVPIGLLVMVVATTFMALFFNLTAIASIGSAVALAIFTLVTVSHIRVRLETGASLPVLVVALLLTLASLISFATTLVEEPRTMVSLVGLLVLATVLDVACKRERSTRHAPASMV